MYHYKKDLNESLTAVDLRMTTHCTTDPHFIISLTTNLYLFLIMDACDVDVLYFCPADLLEVTMCLLSYRCFGTWTCSDAATDVSPATSAWETRAFSVH